MKHRIVRGLILATLLTAPWAAPPAARAQPPDVDVEAVVTGIGDWTSMTHAGDGRLFLTRLSGQVRVLEGGGLLPEPFLDLSDRILGQGFGLFGLAFHPSYGENGFFFVHYAAKNGDSVIARYRVSDDDPNRAVATSERILLAIPKAERLHYGGQLAFGPDGYLWVSTGDGTGRGRVVDPQCAAQSLASLEGKILRLDVDGNVDEAPYYAVPPDNPFAGGERGEIWALGLRNPWRFSFDRATGDLWIADVGQDRREEVDYQPSASPGGENYGWKVMEGSFCFDNRGGCPATLAPCDDPGFTPPVLQYAHAEGRCSVIGGYVYRGDALPALRGRYLYGDYCTGEVWAARPSGGGWQAEPLPFTVPFLTSFGEDAAGEIWLAAGDALYRLVGSGADGGEPCVAGENRLCLNQGRFAVSVSWRTAEDLTGLGHAVSLGEDSGYFWFFSPNNPELFVKVLDGCFDPFQTYWVFAAGLTDVETRLEVVDTRTGETRQYESRLGEGYEPVRDTQAFATCP